MKVLFCLPDQIVDSKKLGVKYRPCIGIPLGVLYMAAYLRQQNWRGEMEVYDARLSGQLYQDLDEGLCFGDRPEESAARIAAAKPDVIAVSNMFSWQVNRAFKMAHLARRVCPNSVIVFGGPHAASCPRETLAVESIDYVVMGEGEQRFHKLLLALEAGEKVNIEGVIDKGEKKSLLKPDNKSSITFIQDLDALPLPAYDMVDIERYFFLQSHGFSSRPREWGRRSVSILTSRGCPHRCVFCSIHATMGYKWRHHSPEYVGRHIQHLVDHYGIDFIHFEDDNLMHDPVRYDEIIDLLLARKNKIPWDTPNGVRGDAWTLERVQRTKQSNCQYLLVAIESGVQRVLDNVVKKRLNLSRVIDMMKDCKKCGVRLEAFYVIGLPGESEADIRQTMDFAMDCYDRYNVYPSIGIAIPLPGTELYNMAVENHLYEGNLQYKENQIVTKEFNPKLVKQIYEEAIRRKLLIFIKNTLTSLQNLKYNIKLVIRYRSLAIDVLKHGIRGMIAKLKNRRV